MVANEICRQYDNSADKAEMIQILADLNECTKKDIVELLESNGREIPSGRKGGIKKCTKPKGVVNISMPESVRNILSERLDELDSQIKALENEYKEIASFLCG